MKKVKKGDYGYIRYEKKKRLLTTVVLFLIPLAAFLAAFLITGTKKNIITVIAMVGCLPACRALVNMIMMWLQKPMDAKVYKKIQAHEGELEVTYETYLTTYEKSVFVESFAVCGNKVTALNILRIQGHRLHQPYGWFHTVYRGSCAGHPETERL